MHNFMNYANAKKKEKKFKIVELKNVHTNKHQVSVTTDSEF